MTDLQKALADIGNIRATLAAGTMFRGFGPTIIAVTGIMALATATVQSLLLPPVHDPMTFVAVWTGLAIICAVLIGGEMVARTKRHHGGLADAMLLNTIEHFLPIGAAGIVVCVVLLKWAPDSVWLLPGLWQLLIGVGLFVALRFLPRPLAVAAGWYFLVGAVVLGLSAQSRTLSPWAMGVPFGVGQLLAAALLRVAQGDQDA
jgi:hypothetical protein